MKKADKLFVIVLAAIMIAANFSGCRHNAPGTEELDLTKTQLYVQVWKGGFGTDWIYKLKERFEQAYANESFEEGKTGVQVYIDPTSTKNIGTIGTSPNEVIFYEDLPYVNYVATGTFLDISDIVKEKLPGESESIENKMYNQHKKALTGIDGKYYAVPFYESYFSLMYDVDLFEQKRLYLAADADNANNGFIMSLQDERSAGPDGQSGTSDDGLPATYLEMFKLCEQMVSLNVTPFVFTGKSPNYIRRFAASLSAAMAGAAQYYTNYNYSGTNTIIDGFFDEKIQLTSTMSTRRGIEKEVEITPETGYNLTKQKGTYYSLAFIEAMLSKTSYYSPKIISETFSHLDAQEEFIYSRLDGSPIGMLVDGSYWENEAKETFERSIQDKGDIAKNRRFGIMPLPRFVDGEVDQKGTTLLDNANSFIFINGNIANKPEKVKLAKLFVQFCCTDVSLQEFNTTTGARIALNYELTAEQYNSMNSYRQTLYDMRKDAEVVYLQSDSDFYLRAGQNAYSQEDRYKSTINNEEYLFPQKVLIGIGDPKFTAEQYFVGGEYSKEKWDAKYSQYYAN